MKKISLLILLTVLSLSSTIVVAQNLNDDPLQVKANLNAYEIHPGQAVELALDLTLPKGFHAYEDQFKIEALAPEELFFGKYTVSPLVSFYDKFSKKQRDGIAETGKLFVQFDWPLKTPFDEQNLKLQLTYQACSETVCLFPKIKEISVPVKILRSSNDENKITGPISLIDSTFYEVLSKGLGWTLLFVFLAGFLTSLTPCIFPMIPITLAVLGRGSSGRSRMQNFSISLSYVLGLSVTYSLLGLLAASTGAIFGSFFNSPFFLTALVILFFALSLSMYGAFELQTPLFLQKRLQSKSSNRGLFGAFLAGLFAGLVASPCVGPVLVGILAFVAKTQDLFMGFTLLFVFSLGLGSLFIILGLTNHASRYLPKSGPWLESVKFFFGTIMLAVALYYASILLPIRWWHALTGLCLITLASIFGAFLNANTARPIQLLRKGLMLLLFFVGVSQVIWAVFDISKLQSSSNTEVSSAENEIQWQPYQDSILSFAQKEQKPVVIDFFADWCVACKELESKTFTSSEIIKFKDQIIWLKFDATKDSKELDILREKYEIQGLPHVVFINSKGEWQKDLTLNGFEEAADFKKRLLKISVK